MLLLKRRAGESILIGDDIVVAVRYIGRTSVRLEIHAPPETKILRQELLSGERNGQYPGEDGESC